MLCLMFLEIGGGFFEKGTIIEVLPQGHYIGPGDMAIFMPVTANLSNISYAELRMQIDGGRYKKKLDLAQAGISEATLVRRRLQRSGALVKIRANEKITEMDLLEDCRPRLDKIVEADIAMGDTTNIKQIPVIVDSHSDEEELGRI